MRYVLAILLCLLPSLAMAQATVKNPTKAVFTCSSDHAQHTAHELDILKTDGTVLQTLVLGTATPDASNEVTLTISVQPITFGSYTAKIRSVAGTFKSADSPASDVWERAPGQPAKPKVQ